MTINYRVDAEAGVVLTTGEGALTDSELQAYVATVLSHPEVRPGFNELIDLRTVTRVQVSDRGMSIAGQAILEVEPQVKETKTALVASDDNADEISRLYEILRTNFPTTVRLFRDLSAARTWLGLPDDDPKTARDRRGAPRKQVHFLVLCRSGVKRGSAQLVDISRTGARLESTSIRPAQGMLVKIRPDPPDPDAPLTLEGLVVRTTGTGFAIRFLQLTQEILKRGGVLS